MTQTDKDLTKITLNFSQNDIDNICAITDIDKRPEQKKIVTINNQAFI